MATTITGSSSGGVSPGIVDTVESAALVTPDSTNDANGFTVKAPDATWGDGTYGTGDAFLLLREDYAGGAEVEPDRNVLFRVDGNTGAVGSAGAVHLATGLRKHSGDVMPYSLHIDPSDDCVGIYIDASSETPATDYLQCRLNAGTAVFKVDSAGATRAINGLSLSDAAPGAKISLPVATGVAGGIDFGGDAGLHRSAVGALRISRGLGAAGNVGFQITSLSDTSYALLQLGRLAPATGLWLGVDNGGSLGTGMVAGDTAVKNSDATKRLWIGTGTVPDELRVDDGEIGFFGVEPVARAAAYTQTYATVSRTNGIAANTAHSLGAVYSNTDTNNALNDLGNKLNLAKQLLNGLIDDLQAYGLLQ